MKILRKSCLLFLVKVSLYLLFIICFYEHLIENLSNTILDKVENLFYEKMTLCSKTNCFQKLSVIDKMCSMNFFLLIQSEWGKRRNNFTIFFKKQHFAAFLKTAISLAAIWAFEIWLRCHITPILLIEPKQWWCHLEAFECIFYVSIKEFRTFHQLILNQQNRASRTYGEPCS